MPALDDDTQHLPRATSSKTMHRPRPLEAPATIAVLDITLVVSIFPCARSGAVKAHLASQIIPETAFSHREMYWTAGLIVQKYDGGC